MNTNTYLAVIPLTVVCRQPFFYLQNCKNVALAHNQVVNTIYG